MKEQMFNHLPPKRGKANPKRDRMTEAVKGGH